MEKTCKTCANGPYDCKNECCFYCENYNFWLSKDEYIPIIRVPTTRPLIINADLMED